MPSTSRRPSLLTPTGSTLFRAMSLLPSALNANRITVLGWPKLTHSGGSCSTPSRSSCESFSTGRTCSSRFHSLELGGWRYRHHFCRHPGAWDQIIERQARRAFKIFIKWRTALASTRSSRRPDLEQLKSPADEDLVQRLGGMASHLDRAFWTFLYRPQYWELACLFAGADAISSAAWEKHPRVPRVSPRIDDEALGAFAGALGHYFRTMEGRGHRCDVKVCDRGDGLLYVFCLLEQPSRADPEWRPEGLRRRTHKPAQPLTFMYSQAAGELDTYLRAKPRVVWDVTAIFAQHILGVKKLEPPPKGHGVYRLDSFKRRGTAYSYGPESGISMVAVRRLRLTPKFGPKLHVILEANPIGRHEPVYDALERDLQNSVPRRRRRDAGRTQGRL